MHAGNAYALECRSGAPSLDFSTSTARTEYIRVKSSKDLSQMHGDLQPGQSVGGLGGGQLGFQTETRFEIVQTGEVACLKFKRVIVDFFSKPRIHIASNFSRSSCEYNAVMTHEKKHTTALLKFQREYAPKARAEISRIIESIDPAMGPLRSGDIKKAQTLIQAKLSTALQAYNKKIMAVLAARQEAIDSPEEYASVVARCEKWEQKLAKEPKKR